MTKERRRPLRYRGIALRSPAERSPFAPEARQPVEHPAFAAPPKRRIRKFWASLKGPAIPPPVGWPLIEAWALILLPAALGAALNWHFLVALALIVPGVELRSERGRRPR